MRKLPRWQKIVIVAFVLTFFIAINLAMNVLMKMEQTQFQEDIFSVQKSIIENTSGDFNTGTELIDQLIEENHAFNQKINYEVLDKLLEDTTDERAFEILEAFMIDDVGTMNVYDIKTRELLYTIGKDSFYIPQPNIRMGEALKKPGYYKVADNPFKTKSTSDAKSKLYTYCLGNKPWLVIINRLVVMPENVMNSTGQMIDENMRQIDKYLHYDFIVLNSKNEVVKSSKTALIGNTAYDFKPAPSSFSESGSNNYAFSVVNASGEIRKYIGSVSSSESNRIIFATDIAVYYHQSARIKNFFIVSMIINIALALLSLKLVLRNYLYFIENQPEEDPHYE